MIEPMEKARLLVSIDRYAKTQVFTEPKDINLVWFVWVLSGWKALFTSHLWDDTSYYEVTYNASKHETYVDHYTKVSNKAYSDEEFEKSAFVAARDARVVR